MEGSLTLGKVKIGSSQLASAGGEIFQIRMNPGVGDTSKIFIVFTYLETQSMHIERK